jgi:hypothetical protein
MTSFFHAFFSAIDSSLDEKTITDYIQKRAAVKLSKSSEATVKPFGKYIVVVSNVINGVTVRFERYK